MGVVGFAFIAQKPPVVSGRYLLEPCLSFAEFGGRIQLINATPLF
jgi:hypothetical protein